MLKWTWCIFIWSFHSIEHRMYGCMLYSCTYRVKTTNRQGPKSTMYLQYLYAAVTLLTLRMCDCVHENEYVLVILGLHYLFLWIRGHLMCAYCTTYAIRKINTHFFFIFTLYNEAINYLRESHRCEFEVYFVFYILCYAMNAMKAKIYNSNVFDFLFFSFSFSQNHYEVK